MTSEFQPWPAHTSYSARWACTLRAVARVREHLRGVLGVVSIGPGFAHHGARDGTRRGSFRRVDHGSPHGRGVVPCVQIVAVEANLENVRKRAAPKERGFAWVGKRRIAVDVPIEVRQFLPSRLHSGPWEVTASGRRVLTGTATAFVRRNHEPEQYLLSCGHLLAQTEYYRLPDDGSVPEVDVSYEDNPLGALAVLPPGGTTYDAALASCDEFQPQIEFSIDGRQIRLHTHLTNAASLPQDVFVLTRRGVIPATTDGLLHDHAGRYYLNDQPTWIARNNVLKSVAKEGHHFEGGDSGAAVVTADGTLVAMHYAGTDVPDDEEEPGIDSYAIMAADIFGTLKLRLYP